MLRCQTLTKMIPRGQQVLVARKESKHVPVPTACQHLLKSDHRVERNSQEHRTYWEAVGCILPEGCLSGLGLNPHQGNRSVRQRLPKADHGGARRCGRAEQRRPQAGCSPECGNFPVDHQRRSASSRKRARSTKASAAFSFRWTGLRRPLQRGNAQAPAPKRLARRGRSSRSR